MSKECDIQNGKYQHYKGGKYQVLGTVTHSETEETLVLYKPLYGKQDLWVRPINMFVEKVSINDEEVERFTYIGK